ncbi:MAG: hypothetical protein ACOVS5_03130 [Oligoflexus sp.]
MELGDIATWISAVVAIASAVLASRSSRDADKYQEQASLALLKQNQLRERQWAEQYFADVRDWANEVCAAIAEALHLSRYPEIASDPNNRLWIEAKISRLLDTGRWYFPNHWSDDYGKNKEPAYRGIRQPILEYVFQAYNATHAMEQRDACKKSLSQLVAAQRGFVSEVQNVLDPRRREAEVKRVLQEFQVAETLREQSGVVQIESEQTK